jgi:hypothetical protein
MCQGHLLVLNDTILQLVLDDTILQMSVSSETESATVHLVSLWQRENSQNKQSCSGGHLDSLEQLQVHLTRHCRLRRHTQ